MEQIHQKGCGYHKPYMLLSVKLFFCVLETFTVIFYLEVENIFRTKLLASFEFQGDAQEWDLQIPRLIVRPQSGVSFTAQ